LLQYSRIMRNLKLFLLINWWVLIFRIVIF
jgi:hypothetical protein